MNIFSIQKYLAITYSLTKRFLKETIFLVYKVNISAIISGGTLSSQHGLTIAVLKSEHRTSSQNWANYRGIIAHEAEYSIYQRERERSIR